MSDERERWTAEDVAAAMRRLGTTDERAAAQWLTDHRNDWMDTILG